MKVREVACYNTLNLNKNSWRFTPIVHVIAIWNKIKFLVSMLPNPLYLFNKILYSFHSSYIICLYLSSYYTIKTSLILELKHTKTKVYRSVYFTITFKICNFVCFSFLEYIMKNIFHVSIGSIIICATIWSTIYRFIAISSVPLLNCNFHLCYVSFNFHSL